jgi:ABC-type transport system involved in multi-copper enzyme maturation permease subunit
MNALVNSYRSEWILLNRKKLWIISGLTTVVFTIAATSLAISTAKPLLQNTSAGLALEAILGSGGATAAVIFSVAFSSILVLAAFASSTGNEFTRGTLRTAFTHQPRRLTVMSGKLAARVTVAAALMVVALGVGAATAAVVAPAEDIDTTGWFGMDALVEASGDYVRLLAFVVMYAVIGTTVAVLVRSTPIALAVGLVWFGPFENVIGDGKDWADRWFPGLLLRQMLQPDLPGSISTGTAATTLAAYAAICVATTAIVLRRRDVTS